MSIERVGSSTKGDRMAFGPKHMKRERHETRTHVTATNPDSTINLGIDPNTTI